MLENPFNNTLVLAAIVFAASFVLGFPVCSLLRRMGVVDRPNNRSSHDRPTVRGGGIAIIATIVLGAALVYVGSPSGIVIGLIGIGLGLAILSFWDDLRSIPSSIRFGGHALAALATLALLDWPQMSIGISESGTVAVWTWLGIILLFLWISGYTNAFNFMDGINGIAAGQATVTGVGMGCIAGIVSHDWTSPPVFFSIVLGTSAAGFFPHNFPRARMFMGDVSSAPLGFFLASTSIWIANSYGWDLLMPLALLHANFVLDTAITLSRRFLRGDKWYSAHREHFYQRLVRAGKTHTFVTLFEIGLQVVVAAMMIVYVHVGVAARIGLIFLVLTVWLVFFLYCEFEFRKSLNKTTDTI